MIPAAGAECACSLFFAFNTRDIKEQARKLHEFSSRLLFPSHLNGPEIGFSCMLDGPHVDCVILVGSTTAPEPFWVCIRVRHGDAIGDRVRVGTAALRL